MKELRVRLTPETAGIVRKLHPQAKGLFKKAVSEIAVNPWAGHELQEELAGLRSFKVKRYRIVYRVNEAEGFVEVYHFGHRREIYEQLRRSLLEKR